MAVTLTPVGYTPGQSQFGLDKIIVHYKCDQNAVVVLTDPSVPQKGDVLHATAFPFMFLTDRNVQETGESAAALDLVYEGALKDDGGGHPILPPQKHEDDNEVMSASSSRSASGIVLSSPATVQYYAPVKRLSYFSYGGRGTMEAAVPDDDVQIITLTIGDTTISFGGSVQEIINDFFSSQIISTRTAPEVVAGKYWANSATKKKTLSPFIFTLPSGPFLILADPGSGYTVGDTLTISGGGGTAVIVLTQVGISNSVTGWTISSITCTTAQNLVPASGGSGSGAKFNIVITP